MTMRKLHQIIVVDDDELSSMITKLLLENFAVADRIVVFCDPEKVLDYFAGLMSLPQQESALPELLLTDFNMLGINGLEMILQLRQMGVPSRVLCFILSGSAEIIDPMLLQSNGADGQLIKPLDKKLLQAMLQSASLQPAGRYN